MLVKELLEENKMNSSNATERAMPDNAEREKDDRRVLDEKDVTLYRRNV